MCAEIAEAMGYEVEGFIDIPRTPDERINGKPIVCRDLQEFRSRNAQDALHVFIAASLNSTRCELVQQAHTLGFSVPALVAPSAVLSPTRVIGCGTVVMPGAIVNANTRVGSACILNTMCSIDHDSVLEDGVQIAPGVHGASTVHYGAQSYVGIGACIKQCVCIGARATVGAGAVVIRDVPDGVTVVGNPARVMIKRQSVRS